MALATIDLIGEGREDPPSVRDQYAQEGDVGNPKDVIPGTGVRNVPPHGRTCLPCRGSLGAFGGGADSGASQGGSVSRDDQGLFIRSLLLKSSQSAYSREKANLPSTNRNSSFSPA